MLKYPRPGAVKTRLIPALGEHRACELHRALVRHTLATVARFATGGGVAVEARVTGSPEELIVDFGLNPQPIGMPTKPIVVNQRIILNFFTAKRLLHALQLSVQRHEAFFGVLETDVQKRVNRNTGNQQ